MRSETTLVSMRRVAMWPVAVAVLAGAGLAVPPAGAATTGTAVHASASASASAAPSAAPATRAIDFRGYRFRVPASWPVFRVGPHSKVCVRFNRHAVYLGEFSLAANCGANLVGRTEAIWVQPLGAASAVNAGDAVTAGAAGRVPSGAFARSSGQIVIDVPSVGVQVTAGWQTRPGLVREILSTASADRHVARTSVVRHPAGARVPRAAAAASRPDATPTPATYTGLGFDLCGLPSVSTLTKWNASPYRALNLYIGGANAACPQTPAATWIQQVTALGWVVIPTYVGLQAPHNACGCAGINPTKAYKEGLTAAADAMALMAKAGMGPQNPIYFDMEGYNPGKSNTPAVLTFLKAWTIALHKKQYLSGVYSSADSGMPDLAKRWTNPKYVEPDFIWFALWDNVKTTALDTIPATDWAGHQRIHQYDGGRNLTYGGVTLNVDGDYCDSGVVAATSL